MEQKVKQEGRGITEVQSQEKFVGCCIYEYMLLQVRKYSEEGKLLNEKRY